jgi:hypothetical protein
MLLRRLMLSVLSVCAFAAVNPELPSVKTVYLLPMSNGLDQYLANRLTKGGRFEVVTDPEKADAVFTDRIGLAFEQRWDEIYPPPPDPKVEEEEKPTDKTKPTGKTEKGRKGPDTLDNSDTPVVHISSFNKGRGNVFLVSRKTRAVVWSHYAVPKNMRSKSMDETADRIVDRLQDDLKPKK